MQLLDANILIGAFRSDHEHHAALRRWLAATVGSGSDFGFPALVEVAFVRIVTHPKIFAQPSTIEEATAFLAAVTASEGFREVAAASGARRFWRRLCLDLRLAGNDVNDAFLAANAIDLGARLVSTDGGFARFPGLDWLDPTSR